MWSSPPPLPFTSRHVCSLTVIGMSVGLCVSVCVCLSACLFLQTELAVMVVEKRKSETGGGQEWMRVETEKQKQSINVVVR